MVRESNPENWDIEPIENFLDEHLLYRGVHKMFWRHWDNIEEVEPNFFTISDDSDDYELSVDWSKYADAEFTFSHLIAKLKPKLKIFGVIEFNIGELRICIQENQFPIGIRHVPLKEITDDNPYLNRSHSLIEGFTRANYSKIRTEISELAKWSDNFMPIR